LDIVEHAGVDAAGALAPASAKRLNDWVESKGGWRTLHARYKRSALPSEFLDRLESYVREARKELGWPDRLVPTLSVLTDNDAAWSLFKNLVGLGASPLALTEHIEEWLVDVERRWGSSKLKGRTQIDALAKRLAKDADDLEAIYAQMSNYWRREFNTPPSNVLRHQADILREAARAMPVNRGQGSTALTLLLDHLRRRTGRACHTELAALLEAIHPRGMKVTVKSLELAAANAGKRKRREMPSLIAREATPFGGMFEKRRTPIPRP
jgi:hypothetical protein